jgi:hypothetical protein
MIERLLYGRKFSDHTISWWKKVLLNSRRSHYLKDETTGLILPAKKLRGKIYFFSRIHYSEKRKRIKN